MQQSSYPTGKQCRLRSADLTFNSLLQISTNKNILINSAVLIKKTKKKKVSSCSSSIIIIIIFIITITLSEFWRKKLFFSSSSVLVFRFLSVNWKRVTE